VCLKKDKKRQEKSIMDFDGAADTTEKGPAVPRPTPQDALSSDEIPPSTGSLKRRFRRLTGRHGAAGAAAAVEAMEATSGDSQDSQPRLSAFRSYGSLQLSMSVVRPLDSAKRETVLQKHVHPPQTFNERLQRTLRLLTMYLVKHALVLSNGFSKFRFDPEMDLNDQVVLCSRLPVVCKCMPHNCYWAYKDFKEKVYNKCTEGAMKYFTRSSAYQEVYYSGSTQRPDINPLYQALTARNHSREYIMDFLSSVDFGIRIDTILDRLTICKGQGTECVMVPHPCIECGEEY